MRLISTDIWKRHKPPASVIVIPTNTTVGKHKRAIMGRGLAAQANKLYPMLSGLYGRRISKGTTIDGFTYFRKLGLIMLPVKRHYSDIADIKLIASGMELVAELMHAMGDAIRRVYVPMLGCGFGGLSYEVVLPIILQHYVKRMVIVIPPNEVYGDDKHRTTFLPGVKGRKDRRVGMSGEFGDIEI